MTNLEFAYAPSGKRSGSGRTFTAPQALGGASVRLDKVRCYFCHVGLQAKERAASSPSQQMGYGQRSGWVRWQSKVYRLVLQAPQISEATEGAFC